MFNNQHYKVLIRCPRLGIYFLHSLKTEMSYIHNYLIRNALYEDLVNKNQIGLTSASLLTWFFSSCSYNFAFDL